MIQFDEKRLKQIARAQGLDLIVLFGSQATGRARPDSDIDMAARLRPGHTLTPDRKSRLAAALAAVFPAAEVDVTILNEAGSMLLFEVATSGRPLFERRPLLYWQFQSYAARRYDDDHKYRLPRAAYLKRRTKQWAREKKISSAKS